MATVKRVLKAAKGGKRRTVTYRESPTRLSGFLCGNAGGPQGGSKVYSKS